MTQKKASAKQQTYSRVSLVSGLLDGAVRATLPAPAPQEPWRNRRPKGRNRGKGHK